MGSLHGFMELVLAKIRITGCPKAFSLSLVIFMKPRHLMPNGSDWADSDYTVFVELGFHML